MYKKISLLLFCFWLASSSSSVAGSDLFPEFDGWTMEEYEKAYHPGDLWELINGAAEGFLNYGFENLHLAEYTRNDEIIRVEIYRHSSTENAYGMYSAERMQDYQQIKIGAQGYASEGVVNFFTGPFYIKIMTVGIAEVDASDVLNLAEQVDKHMDQSSQMPAMLALFPEEGREYLSDQYIATSFLGYGFLHSAFTVRYNKNGNLQLFIIKSSPDEVQQMIERYKEILGAGQIQQKDALYILNDRYNGTVFLKEHAEYLIGVLNTDDEQVAVEYIHAVTDKLP